MQTRFDDAEMMSFLQSMPFRVRRRVVHDSLGNFRIFWLSSALALCGLCSMFVMNLIGVFLGVATLVLSSGVFGFLMVIYRNKVLRKFLCENLVDGILPTCPACMRDQLYNRTKNCDCGCIVRPFSNI